LSELPLMTAGRVGSGRLCTVEKVGPIRFLASGEIPPTPILDPRSLVVTYLATGAVSRVRAEWV
jgi:hypothetical protein